MQNALDALLVGEITPDKFYAEIDPIQREQLRNDHLNECHPEPHHHSGCPICETQDRIRK